MQALRPDFVLASAALAFAMVLGGAQARVGYVSVAVLVSQDGVGSLVQRAAPLVVDHEASGVMADVSNTASLRRETHGPHASAIPYSPLPNLPQASCPFGHAGTSSSSRYSSGNSPSTLSVDDLPHSFVSPPVLAGFLRPQMVDVPPYSVVCVPLRHPPRSV